MFKLLVAGFGLSSLCLGCGALAAAHSEHESSEHPAASSSAHAAASASGSAQAHGAAHGAPEAPHASGAHSGESGKRFPVPFGWEASSADPLHLTRGYMRELAADNASYVKAHPPASFKPFLEAQHPRATVVTCSDSRVQSTAFDATPENDIFFIRNIGNQIANSQGSVEYGVHHLKTPVIMIIGHTGCGAIKAAMGDFSKESPAIQKELSPLTVPKNNGSGDPKAWMEAVTANVNSQVKRAIELFGHELGGGDLTVVGAVYDLRNEMKQGHGKLVVVNVNGQTESARVSGFVRATASASPAPLSSALAARDFH
jgi:carbonic anhydrase